MNWANFIGSAIGVFIALAIRDGWIAWRAHRRAKHLREPESGGRLKS